MTSHPQLISGLAQAGGVFVAFPASGVNITVGLDSDAKLYAATWLSMAIVFWTLLNDTIYAAQDVEDDKKAGVGSTVMYWGDKSKTFLSILGIAQVLALLCVASYIKVMSACEGYFYTLLACGGTAIGLGIMIYEVNLSEPSSCGWWFNR